MTLLILIATAAQALTWDEAPNAGNPPVGVVDITRTLGGTMMAEWDPFGASGYYVHRLGKFRGTTAELGALAKRWVSDGGTWGPGHAGAYAQFGPITCQSAPCASNSYRTLDLVVDGSQWIFDGEDEWGVACIPIDPLETIPESSTGPFNCEFPLVEFHIQTPN